MRKVWRKAHVFDVESEKSNGIPDAANIPSSVIEESDDWNEIKRWDREKGEKNEEEN